MTSKVDERRMRDAAAGLSLPAGQTVDEIRREIDGLGDALAAAQSLDDLGSPQANDAAMRVVDDLIAQYKDAKRRLAEVLPNGGDPHG